MAVELGSPFGRHMVLQRGRRNALWGWDRPDHDVVVQVHGDGDPVTLNATTSSIDGSFRVELPELRSAGVYRIVVSGSSKIELEDVVVGEVWLASGQSNMEWTVAHAAGSLDVVREADDPGIRWLHVARRPDRVPRRRVDATWRVVRPDNVESMTAVGYAFARTLRRRLGVPVGVVDASWGGTPIEAWTSLDALRPSMPGLDAELAELARAERDADRVRAEYGAIVTRWEAENLPADPGNEKEAAGWARPDFDASGWGEMRLPSYWQAHGMRFNGVVWFRLAIDLPPSWAGRDCALQLGAIDDFDRTYFNGEIVGEHPEGTPGAYQLRRRYRVPGRLVRAGRNVLAVRVFDHAGRGGFAGPSQAMSIAPEGPPGASVSLAGTWRFAVEHAIDLVPASVWDRFPEMPAALAPQNAPGALFGGMLAPLVPFGLGGVIWYQGEANIAAHASYRARLIALIRDLRSRFGQGQIPFYFVQLAAFRASLEWAYLREAQSDARSEPATAMASAIDIGDPDDIHPTNKGEVGRRLANLALRHAFDLADVEADGPRLARVEIRGGEARVHFVHGDGLRTSDASAVVTGFELAGDDLVFRRADGRIDGRTVVVRSASVAAPVAVRYAFADFTEVNLVNGAGLPAEPFRTDAA